LNTGLALKSNISDVSRTIADIASSLDGKLSVSDCHAILKDYALNDDLNYLLSNKVNKEEIRALTDNRVGLQDFRREVDRMDDKLTDFYNETQRKFSSLATQRDFQNLTSMVESKVSVSQLNTELELKADKQTVEKALNKKINRSDMDSILAKKADLGEMQTIFEAIERKMSSGFLDRFTQLIEDKADKNEISLLASTIASKADKTDLEYFASSLSSVKVECEYRLGSFDKKLEATRNDIESTRQFLTGAINKKAEAKELERLAQLVSNKVDIDFIEENSLQLRRELADQAEDLKGEILEYKRNVDNNVTERAERSENFYSKITDDVYKLSDQIKNVLEMTRNDREQNMSYTKEVSSIIKKEVNQASDRFGDDLQGLRKEIGELYSKKLDKKEWNEARSKLLAQLDGKVDLLEVQDALNTCQADLSSRFIEYKEEIKNLIRNHDSDIYGLLSKKANISDINSILANKADSNTVNAVLAQKVDGQEVEELKRKIDVVMKSNNEKATFREIEVQSLHQKKQLEDLQRDMVLKANIKDVCTLLDTKSNIDDVNKALLEIHKELDSKIIRDELATIVNDQALINESLCTENIVGRWAWKSGEVKSGSMVPWEIQLTNTLPDNFLWEKDKGSILTVAPGLYEITFGFFAKKKPTVQLMVNGEPIMSAVNTSSYVIHHSSGKMKDVNVSKHPSGNITGLTLIDFIVLPARARISVAYTGDIGGEGFLGLKRL